MADAKRIAKQILRGIGKGFYYFGKGIYIFAKFTAKQIGISYRNYQKQKRIEEQQSRYDRQTERENYYAGRGYARGMADVREIDRAKRQNERNSRKYLQNMGNQMFDVPKVNDDYFNQDPFNPKRKRRYS